MNYYYELHPESKVLFQQQWKYWCMPNCSPAEGGYMNFKLHDEYVSSSSRVWLENANGVYLVRPEWEGRRYQVCPREFTMIKLKSKNLYRAYDDAWT